MTKTQQALSRLLCNHFKMHRARVDSLTQMIFCIIKVSSVQLTALSRGFDSSAQVGSTLRRLQRFFQFQELKLENVAKLIFALIPLPAQIILTLDRTNWKFGAKDINFLTMAFVYKGVSIPFLWQLLDHKGNSNTSQRISLLEKGLKILCNRPIYCLLADREFIGQAWFSWLINAHIPFCIRLKETTSVRHKNGGKVPIKNLCRALKVGETLTLQNSVWSHKVSLTCLRLTTGELLILASPFTFKDQMLTIYVKRWTIECLFKSLKSQGFNLEVTHLKHCERLSKLFALCAIAFAWSVKIGEIKNTLIPIKIKNHGRPLYSLFTYGFHALQAFFFKDNPTKKLLNFLDFSTQNSLRIFNCQGVTVVY
jgi:hypothetical protein